MNDHFEELIRDGIDHLTVGSSLPAGLADRARGRVRRRQHQIRAAVAAGTAAAAALAVIAATSAGSAGPTPRTAAGPRPASSIALLAKVERAVASKAGSAPVLRIRTTFSGGQGLPMPDPFIAVPYFQGRMARTEIAWARGNVFKFDLLNAQGQIVTAAQATDRRGLGTTTSVDYSNRTWWRFSPNWAHLRTIHSCTLLPFGPQRPRDWSPRNLSERIKHAVACGRVKVTGRQHVDGVDAIKLTFTTGFAITISNGPAQAFSRQILWVDPNSYLPLRFRSTLTWTHAKHGSRHGSAWLQSDFQWLAATKGALAKLQLTIPSGFRHKLGPIYFAPLPRQ